MIKNIIALILILIGVFGLNIKLPDFPKPKPSPEVSILNIDKPSEEILSLVRHFDELITDPTDRAKIAIFNYQFATNIKTYNTTLQKTNDIYTLAGKNFFKGSIAGKYEGLSEAIIKQLESIVSNDDHTLSEKEKQDISDRFMAIAWVLIQRESQ